MAKAKAKTTEDKGHKLRFIDNGPASFVVTAECDTCKASYSTMSQTDEGMSDARKSVISKHEALLPVRVQHVEDGEGFPV